MARRSSRPSGSVVACRPPLLVHTYEVFAAGAKVSSLISVAICRRHAAIHNRAFGAHARDLIGGESGFAQHFDAVLADARRVTVDSRSGAAPAARDAGEADSALARMLHVDEEGDSVEMLVVDQAVQIVHGHAGNVGPLQQPYPFRGPDRPV